MIARRKRHASVKRKRKAPIAYPSAKFQSFLPYLQSLRKSKGKARRQLLVGSNASQLNSINTLCKNLKGGGIFLTQARKKRLSKYKTLIRKLASPQISQKSKRELLINQRGGFIGTLLASLLPPLIGLITRKL